MQSSRIASVLARASSRAAAVARPAARRNLSSAADAAKGKVKEAAKTAEAAAEAAKGKAKEAAKTVEGAASSAAGAAKSAAGGGGGGGGGVILFGLLAGAGGYYAYTQGMLDSVLGKSDKAAEASSGDAKPAGKAPVPAYAAKVATAVESLIDDDDNRGPLLVRLAWHSSGTYAKGGSPAGGSDGARMRFSPEAKDGANAGLEKARALLEPIKKAHPDISYADLYTYAGAVAIEHMGGPHIPFRFGRSDFRSEAEIASAKAAVASGRLPDAAQGASHIRDVFYRMGFNDQEIVALSGAHTLGRCHTDRSGFEGPWSFAPTTMSNQYFDLLNKEIEKPGYWTVRKWDGPKQYKDPTGELMMLPTDMALIEDDKFRPYVQLYAKDEAAFFKDFAAAFATLLHLGVDEAKLGETA